MNRTSLLLLSVLVLSLKAGIGHAIYREAPKSVDLKICVLSVDMQSQDVAEEFVSLGISQMLFDSIIKTNSADAVGDCDVLIRISENSTATKPKSRNVLAEVLSASSGAVLFAAERKRGWGAGFLKSLASEIRGRLENGSQLHQRLVAEKAPGVKAGEKFVATTLVEPQAPAATVPDIDSPKFKNPEDPTSFALVVGVEKYSNDLPEAQFAERDATAVRNYLLALGFPERNIKMLVGSRATKANLDAYLEEWLPRNVQGGGRVFFYFSGHGAPDTASNQAYLVPWDGNPNFLKKTALPIKRLRAALEALKAKQVVVALDSCFSGAGGRSVLAEGARPLVTQMDVSLKLGGNNMVLFAAASPNEITATLKEQGHGIFTYYFLKGLGGEAKDESGAITFRGLYEYLKPRVQDAASRQNRDQNPLLEGVSDGVLVRLE